MSEHRRPLRGAADAPRPRPSGERLLSRNKALPLSEVSQGMVVRRISVAPPEVVFVKGLLEASDGLGAVFAERGGELSLVVPHGREAELDELLADLKCELGAIVHPSEEEA